MTQARQVLYTPIDMDDAQYSDIEQPKSEEQIDWEKFREEMRESNEYAKITIYRQPTDSRGLPGQKKLTYLFDVGLDEYSYSQICAKLRDEYGSGTFRMQGRDSDNRLKFNRAVTIEAPKKELVPYEGGANSTAAVVAEFREMMRESQMQMLEMMRQPQTDPLDQISKLAAVMGSLMGNQKPPTMAEQVKEMMLLKKFMGDLDGSNENDNGNIYSLLGKSLEAFGPLIGVALSAGKKDGTVNEAGIIQGVPAPKQLENPEMNEQQKLVEQHRTNVIFLLNQAKGGAKPENVASFVINAVPDEQLEDFEDF